MAGEAIEGVDWTRGTAVLRLEHGRVSGTGGVNRLLGEYRLVGSRLTLGALASTRMAGPPGLMKSEQQLLAALARVARWAIDDEQLILADGANTEVVRFHPTIDAKESTMELIHTCYRITDPERSIAFYEALGLEKRRELPIREEAMNALTVENMAETLEKLAAQGIEPERPPYSIREGGSLLCFVRDPDQYRIELIERNDY